MYINISIVEYYLFIYFYLLFSVHFSSTQLAHVRQAACMAFLKAFGCLFQSFWVAFSKASLGAFSKAIGRLFQSSWAPFPKLLGWWCFSIALWPFPQPFFWQLFQSGPFPKPASMAQQSMSSRKASTASSKLFQTIDEGSV